ncbi:GntR family transcriptional regulator [Azospirillum isscasi]|uniref:GntR family transcriptional regulator n=1 Tax=Azospirillum isscasi TaxID=3053926 RepID=A0ABU0WGS0_9PROT|nr:GntR family transcriptional regulator [Azospirillum isscasi]MDQ2103413.1 GntR family transcriptional regulator [Azospirillum isscasi]
MPSDISAAAPPRQRRPAAVRPAPRSASPIYRDLRNDILSMRRRPGEPIAEARIAETYGVSRTPVHEAVLRLADEGLIDVFPQSGTYVSLIPIAALPEAGVIRRALEEATVRMAATRATASHIARLRAALEAQRELCAACDRDGFHEADERFHALLAEVAGFPGFWALVQQVKVQVDRCRRLTLPVPGQMAKVIAEHEAIVEAVAAHDREASVLALGAHLDGLRLTIDDLRAAAPLYFTEAA